MLPPFSIPINLLADPTQEISVPVPETLPSTNMADAWEPVGGVGMDVLLLIPHPSSRQLWTRTPGILRAGAWTGTLHSTVTACRLTEVICPTVAAMAVLRRSRRRHRQQPERLSCGRGGPMGRLPRRNWVDWPFDTHIRRWPCPGPRQRWKLRS